MKVLHVPKGEKICWIGAAAQTRNKNRERKMGKIFHN